jgi:uncharacterized integral membrane protein (TIGR00698 family)
MTAVVRPRISEDWLAIFIGGLLVLGSIAAVLWKGQQPLPAAEPVAAKAVDEAKAGGKVKPDKKPSAWSNPLKSYLGVPGKWQQSPLQSLQAPQAIAGALCITLLMFGLGIGSSGGSFWKFLPGFLSVFLLGTVAYVMAEQTAIRNAGLEYALWALLLGLIISNTVGAPQVLKPAIRTELYIKTGLVLLGSEVLLGQLLALGLPGICISWIVTPIVLITTFWFGQRVLKIESASLNMVISADMSVCGVSAAIATAAACRAKKEELSTAVGISLAFTVVMMFVMPNMIGLMDLDPVIAGAWIGGTIDSTGAVGVAGAMIGETAGKVAVTIKMIQNMLIGVVAFGVAVYWVSRVERSEDVQVKPDATEIWRRFPKFILGFIGASLLISLLHSRLPHGDDFFKAVVDGSAKTLRNWCFCLAFVSIGLETDFRSLAHFFRGGKAVTLYVAGQALNLLLSLAMSWFMFRIVFPDAAKVLLEN